MRVHGDALDEARISLWIWLAALGGSFALAPLTESRAYLMVGLFSAGIVCAVGFGLRSLRTPWPLIVVAQLVVLFWWATLTYASETTMLGVLPGLDTPGAFDSLLTRTMQHADQFAPPVPENAALHAVLSISVGLLALAVDLLAGSLRHAPAVGLVFLAIYMAPVALLSGHVSFWIFLPGALGFVFLLAAQERNSITRWGRNISYADSGSLGTGRGIYSSGLASAGRRVGFGAVTLAVVLPVLIPTLSTNFFGRGGIDGGIGDSGGTIAAGNPFIDMRRNLRDQTDEELLRVSSVTTEPTYVRLAALDSLSESGWAPSERGPQTEQASGTLPSAPGGIELPVTSANFEFDIADDFNSNWLPTIYAAQTLDAGGNWRVDGTNLDIVAGDEETSAAGMRYQLGVRLTDPLASQLRAARIEKDLPKTFDNLLALPDVPDILEQKATEVTAGADSPFEQALALETWFRRTGNFTYSLDSAAGSGMETMADFVDGGRTGYCEQFASAMAIMARELGIPSRVAVGFLSGERTGDTYVFRGTDMHAWPELYLGEDIGWYSFEPTPSARTGPAPDHGGTLGNAPTAPENEQQNLPGHTPTEPTDRDTNDLEQNADENAGGAGGGFPWRGAGIAVLVLAALAGLGLLPRQLRARRRERRWRLTGTPGAAAEVAWAELRDSVRDLRLPWPGGTTPRAVGRRLRPMIEADQAAVDSLNTLVLAIERERYAEHSVAVDLRGDVERIGAALAAGVSKRTQRKARWFPLSVIAPMTRGWSRGTDQRPVHTELISLEE